MWYLPSQSVDNIVYFSKDGSGDWDAEMLQTYNGPGKTVASLSNTPSVRAKD